MLSAAREQARGCDDQDRIRVEVAGAPAQRVIKLHGVLQLSEAGKLWRALQAQQPKRGSELRIELDGVTSADGAAVALLTTYAARQRERGVRCEYAGASARLEEIIRLYEGNGKPGRPKRRKPRGLLDQLGAATIDLVLECQLVIAFFGQMLVGVMNAIRAPKTLNWKELTPTMERAGADAVPIAMLINFLVGMVIALQSAGQLKRFGADIFMADLVGISMVREIGPLMTAIVVCGRTGAAIAAELGSMKTNEEIDALRTMGLGPMRFLVLPRTLGLMLVAPLLTVLADLAGGAGGLVIAIRRMDLAASAYLHELQRAVHLHDLISGLIKSLAFALAIALISSQQGLAATGGAEGVGRRTTAAVVSTLFALIVIDALFTVFFTASGFQ